MESIIVKQPFAGGWKFKGEEYSSNYVLRQIQEFEQHLYGRLITLNTDDVYKFSNRNDMYRHVTCYYVTSEDSFNLHIRKIFEEINFTRYCMYNGQCYIQSSLFTYLNIGGKLNADEKSYTLIINKSEIPKEIIGNFYNVVPIIVENISEVDNMLLYDSFGRRSCPYFRYHNKGVIYTTLDALKGMYEVEKRREDCETRIEYIVLKQLLS